MHLENPLRNKDDHTTWITIWLLIATIGSLLVAYTLTKKFESSTPSLGEGLIADRCRSEYSDPVAVTACEVAYRVNMGVSVNGRMTAHEEAIEHLSRRITALEAKCTPAQTPTTN
ncbi:MAG: hypothetical protein NUV84_05145 [Candidatus Uhrbacteria bacterium]|nr:hypothetical protein [Candidatus Uhrbacteria bacterium]